MKELSIEEKARRYDEALEKAKKINNEQRAQPFNIMTKVFPELAEPEDDRIRKELISAIKEDWPGHADWIAWLEKQGNLMKALQFANKTIGEITDENYHLREKLNEQKPYGQREECFDCQCNYAGECKGYCGMKQGEHKPTDNVEPKFKVGDWVVDKNGTVQQILSYKDCIYKHTNGYSSKMFEDVWRLWDITKDAKDGDILCTYECYEPKIVFILKGIPKKHYALSYYCYYNVIYPHFGSDLEKGCLAPNDEDVKPATKEQRDLLFQKMKEAGYEWNAEKKELKKIEQKPTAWSEEDESRITVICTYLQDYARLSGSESRTIRINEYCDWFKSLKDRVQPKQEWSEEDEKMLTSIIACANVNASLNIIQINWLKSLKYEVLPHPKQKLDEDVESAIQLLEHMAEEQEKDSCPYNARDLRKVSKYLKFLRSQNTWKPSDEQMLSLERASNSLVSTEDTVILRNLLNDLKKL